MTQPQLERFYAEYRALGRLVGVREHDLPADWLGYREYFRATCEQQLVRTASVDRVIRSVNSPAAPPVPLPSWAWRVASVPPQRALWLGGIGLTGVELRRTPRDRLVRAGRARLPAARPHQPRADAGAAAGPPGDGSDEPADAP